MKIVKCVCGFTGDVKEFGSLEVSGYQGYGSMIGKLKGNHIGSVDLFVCPNCGLTYTDMRGNISIGTGI